MSRRIGCRGLKRFKKTTPCRKPEAFKGAPQPEKKMPLQK